MTKTIRTIFIASIILLAGCGTSSEITQNTTIIPSLEKDNFVIQDEKFEVPEVQNKTSSTLDIFTAMFTTCPPENLDRDSLQILNTLFAKDKNHVYVPAALECIINDLEGADPKTFVVLSRSFAKDKNSVYNRHGKIEGADIATFKIANLPNIHEGECGQDKNRYYSAPFLQEDNEGNSLDDKCTKVKE